MKTQSKTYPKILRSRKEKMIFFPDNIQQVQREDMEGIKEDFYEYDLIKILDKGQQIEDYELFKTENPYILPVSDESERKDLLSAAGTYAKELTHQEVGNIIESAFSDHTAKQKNMLKKMAKAILYLLRK